MDLVPLLRAHAFIRVEQPPLVWHVAVDDVALIRLLGEMLATTLARGNELGDITLNVANVTVTDTSEPGELPAPGDYVALTVRGRGECGLPTRWWPGAVGGVFVGEDVERAARAAGIPFAYTQNQSGEGSITVFVARSA